MDLSLTRALLSCALVTGVVACGNKSTPNVDKEPLPPPSASQGAASVATAAPAPKGVVSFTLEKFAPPGGKPSEIFAVEGALMVVAEQRVGRIVDDTVEWIGNIPKGSPAYGDNIIQAVNGRWPDAIGALFVTSQGRAPEPTYWPVTGKGLKQVVGEGGSRGAIYGVARVGESTVVASYNMYSPPEITTVRGPGLPRRLTREKEGGCKPGEVWKVTPEQDVIALTPHAFESSPEGTLVSLGRLCERESNPAAEVWDKAGKSRIVDLSRWWKRISYRATLVKGRGDELWAYSDLWNPVLRYHDGAFDAVPVLERPIQTIFASSKGQLHAYDGQTIHRYEEGKWIPVGRFAQPQALRTLAVDDKGAFWASDGGVHKLREAPPAAPPEEGCKTWFVYLYQVNEKAEPKFTFPSTRKALSTFAEVADLGLVEFKEGTWRRQLGVTVASKAQGEAVIAHVRENMKDEDPRLFCYLPPKDARTIDMNAKGR